MGSFDYSATQGAGIKPTGLINGASGTLPVYNGPNDANVFVSINGYIRYVTTGPQVAGVLSTILKSSGKGAISFFGLIGANATSRTHRVKITMDGVVIFDGSGTLTSASQSSIVIGSMVPVAVVGGASAIYSVIPEYLCFDKSLLIEYSSSLPETGKTHFAYRLIPR